MNKFEGLYHIRDGVSEDFPFVYASFLKGLYYGDSWFSQVPKNIFMNNYKIVVKALIENPNTVIKIACLPEDPGVILGYSILSGDYQGIHWVFVKSAWRGKGIGTSLVPKYPSYVTHLTKLGKSLMFKVESAVFDPFKII